MRNENHLILVVDNDHPECLWKILEEGQFKNKCLECEFLSACLIEGILGEIMGEIEFPTFLKKLQKTKNKAERIWRLKK